LGLRSSIYINRRGADPQPPASQLTGPPLVSV
jgi:hypothetical protein